MCNYKSQVWIVQDKITKEVYGTYPSEIIADSDARILNKDFKKEKYEAVLENKGDK